MLLCYSIEYIDFLTFSKCYTEKISLAYSVCYHLSLVYHFDEGQSTILPLYHFSYYWIIFSISS